MPKINYNETKKNKLLSRWTAFLLILFTSIATIFFVDSTIKANEMLKDIETLKIKSEQIKHNNVILMEQINRLQTPERILRIAESSFKMEKIQSPPVVIKIRKKNDARE